MKITRASMHIYAKEHGLESVQVDGIPEGFSFRCPDINIGGKEHIGGYRAFKPLGEWGEHKEATSQTISGLQECYKQLK